MSGDAVASAYIESIPSLVESEVAPYNFALDIVGRRHICATC